MAESQPVMSEAIESTLEALSLTEAATSNGNRRSSIIDADRHKRSDRILSAYLTSNSPEFRELKALREQGWNNPEGDRFFQRQRKAADQASANSAWYFYRMMHAIGDQLHDATSAFKIESDDDHEPKILDMCMAPGGFLDTALKHNPSATALGFSLPVAKGGHRCLMPKTSRVEKHFVDITMLPADMGTASIPSDHQEAGEFLPRYLPTERVFDLVLCDGQVLRTHELASYREKVEARRLTATQLVLGLERLRPGGTIISLMHKADAWRSVQTVYAFSRFAKVELYKPTAGHAKRSSFYLVARNVQSDSPEALAAIERWRETWRVATFPKGGEGEGERVEWEEDPWTANEVIEDFGPELLRMGAPIWKTQAQALANAPFIKGSPRTT